MPFPRPLTVSCVWPLVEFRRITGEKVDDGLTCQLYATIPLGSLTADHEIVNGTTTFAPSAGARGVGAGGTAASARPPAATLRRTTNSSVRVVRIFIMFTPSNRVQFFGEIPLSRK